MPKTSITLLHELAENTASDQWFHFYDTYKDPIFGFVRANYPSLDPDDILQETMSVLAKCLPSYQYLPDVKGHFRCYLMGIVRNKSVDAIRKRTAENERQQNYGNDPTTRPIPRNANDEETKRWQQAAMETAVEQLLADPSFSAQTRSIFEHVALMREDPENVAKQFGVTRNNVDQIKSRMIGKLKEMVRKMTAPDQQPA